MTQCNPLVAGAAPRADLEQAWQTFRQVLPQQAINCLAPTPPQTLYTPWVVTWLLVYQRLDHNATLTQAVDEFKLRFPAEALPRCRYAEGRCFSSNNGAYSSARSRLQLETACAVADHVSDTLLHVIPPLVGQRRCFAFDGTTVLLQPVAALRQAYPGATNQHGESPFPVLHLALAHETTSGLTLRPEYGPKYGPNAQGEVALARRLLHRLPAHSLVLGDGNFGIFAFAWEAQQAGHSVLLRLTKARFQSLVRKAKAVGSGKWELTWKPSAAEKRKYPELPAVAQVDGFLLAVEVDHPKKGKMTLYLFTMEDVSKEQAGAWYRQRWNIETDIRDSKRTLLLAELQGRNVAMVEKEVMLASVAYNLVNQTRRLAAQRAGVPPRRLSFKGVWSILRTLGLSLLQDADTSRWQEQFELALNAAAQRKLPNRKKARQYPREVYMRRRNYPPRKPTVSALSPASASSETHDEGELK